MKEIERRRAWTEAEMKEVHAMWCSGTSASQIAIIMRLTRNAVIGRVHRYEVAMGIRGKRPSSAPTMRRQRRVEVQRTKTISIAALPAATRGRDGRPFTVKDNQCRPLPRPLPEPPDASSRCTLMQLRDGKTCKWPIGGIGTADFAFCGAMPSADSSYCEFHRLRSIQPPRPRGHTA